MKKNVLKAMFLTAILIAGFVMSPSLTQATDTVNSGDSDEMESCRYSPGLQDCHPAGEGFRCNVMYCHGNTYPPLPDED